MHRFGRRSSVALVLGAVVALLFPFGAGAGRAPALRLITEPGQGYAPIYALLASPRHSLDLTMYELEDARAEQILAADAARGVAVRVLLNRAYIGTRPNSGAFSYLSRHGVHVRWASSRIEITHQKSFVIDRRTVVIMTGNLTSRYYSTSRDFAVVDSQRQDVAAVEQTFDLDWANRSGRAPSGRDLLWSPGSEARLLGLIDSARHSLLVENEELRASAIVGALRAAARRGVAVTVVMTRESDWYDAFETLARAGVRVSTYAYSAPLYIHAKVIVADGRRAFVGSENFSIGSMEYNRELGLITASRPIVRALTRVLERDAAGGRRWRP